MLFLTIRGLKTDHTEYLSKAYVDLLNNWEIPLTKITCTVKNIGANIITAISEISSRSAQAVAFFYVYNKFNKRMFTAYFFD